MEKRKQLRALTQTLSFAVGPPESSSTKRPGLEAGCRPEEEKKNAGLVKAEEPAEKKATRINKASVDQKVESGLKSSLKKAAEVTKPITTRSSGPAEDATAALNAAKTKLKALEAEKHSKSNSLSPWCQKFLSSEAMCKEKDLEEKKEDSPLAPMQDFIIEKFRDSQEKATVRSTQKAPNKQTTDDDTTDQAISTVAIPATKRKRSDRPEQRYYTEEKTPPEEEEKSRIEERKLIKQPKLSGPTTIKSLSHTKKSTHKTLVLHKSTAAPKTTTPTENDKEKRVQTKTILSSPNRQLQVSDSLIDIRLELAAASSDLDSFELHIDRAERALALARRNILLNKSSAVQARHRIAAVMNELEALSRS